MANKKCPKCGEDNPAEAVMCWACYTPLTAGAGAAMGAGMGMGGAGAATLPRPGGPVGVSVPTDAGEKKQIDPKIFLVVGLFFVGGVIALFTTGIIGGTTTDGGGPPVTTPPVETNFGTTMGSSTTTSPVTFTPSNQSSSSSAPSSADAPPPAAFSMVGTPNPRYSTATFGITPSQPNISAGQALNLAKLAREQVFKSNGGRYKNAQIIVFKDAQSSTGFRQYMSQKRGEPLTGGDFASLGPTVWGGAIVYYETRGTSARVANPSTNPSGWWGGR